jgi:anti-sigma regulatory factor (Ser/Thr protein kinase)
MGVVYLRDRLFPGARHAHARGSGSVHPVASLWVPAVSAAAPMGVTSRGVTSTGTVSVPYTPSSVSRARRSFLTEVAGSLPEDVCDDAVLVLSELMSNALRHANPLPDGTLQVAWRRQAEGVEVSVTDGGASTRPAARHPSLSALGGRGLAIVGTVTDDWGVRDGDARVTVWARVTERAGHGVGRR